MKMFAWLFAILISGLPVIAQDQNTFASKTVGFTVQKPSHWHFMTAESNADNLSRARMQDEEFQKMVQKYATAPLVVMTKYQEPYDDLNPSFKVNIRPLGSYDGTNPISILELAKAPLQKAFMDYKEVQSPVETQVAGLKAAYMKIHYTLQTSAGQSFATSSELWIVPRGKFFFMIGVGTKQNADTSDKQEIRAIIDSIRIDN